MIWYQDAYCYYARKPHGTASTWGQGPCFLDLFDMIDNTNNAIITDLKAHFSKEEEYGLLNRLDNDTAGLLYFAKNPTIKEQRKELQKSGKLIKYYLADVYGDVERIQRCIAYPLIHHPQAKDRMICITENNDNYNNKQFCETWVEKLFYDPVNNYSCLLVMITKGVRHQIRCHLASIGCPIIGEKIYKKRKDTGNLHLWSVGVRTNS